MRAKETERNQALVLRKHGFSLNEISSKLGISKGTASVWLRDISLSKAARARLKSRYTQGVLKSQVSLKDRTERRLNEASQTASETLFKIPQTNDLSRLYCSLLYWCEGEKSKNDKSLFFTNSDPLLVKAFLNNLRVGYILDESKFRVCIHLHNYHDEPKQLLFWSKVTNIPLAQFIKPYHKKNSGKSVKVGYAGCASVRYHDVRIARQVHALARAFLNK